MYRLRLPQDHEENVLSSASHEDGQNGVEQGRSEVRDAKNNERHVCGRARAGKRPVS